MVDVKTRGWNHIFGTIKWGCSTLGRLGYKSQVCLNCCFAIFVHPYCSSFRLAADQWNSHFWRGNLCGSHVFALLPIVSMLMLSQKWVTWDQPTMSKSQPFSNHRVHDDHDKRQGKKWENNHHWGVQGREQQSLSVRCKQPCYLHVHGKRLW